MENDSPPAAGQRPAPNRLKQVRSILWVLVALAIVASAGLLLLRRGETNRPPADISHAQKRFGGPFTLTGADGKPFSSSQLAGKPHAIFFGFTRCGDVCPNTLGRLVKLRNQAGAEATLPILFITIDPQNDGPQEVGQYASLFGSPIIGLTGSPQQIAQVKKQYGIFAEPNHAATGHGDMISHTSSVLLFDKQGELAGTISAQENDATALETMKRLIV